MRVTLVCLTTALALSACAKSETPEEARAAAQEAYAAYDQRAQEARGDDGLDEMLGPRSPGQINTAGALTPGEWRTDLQGAERIAQYGVEGERAAITVACEIGGGIDIRLPGVAPQGGSSTVNISSPEGSSTFTASDTIADDPETYISVPASDPFVGRLISASGPFSLRMGTDRRIVFPGSDILTSIVSACDRRSDASPPDVPEGAPVATPAPDSGEAGAETESDAQ